MLELAFGTLILIAGTLIVTTTRLMYKDERFTSGVFMVLHILIFAWLLGTVALHYLNIT